jgi:transposase
MHADWRQDCFERFGLLFLPPYSPELNPIERVWKLTRRLATHNRYFAHVDEVAIEVEILFEKWKNANDTLRKLCAII